MGAFRVIALGPLSLLHRSRKAIRGFSGLAVFIALFVKKFGRDRQKDPWPDPLATNRRSL